MIDFVSLFWFLAGVFCIFVGIYEFTKSSEVNPQRRSIFYFGCFNFVIVGLNMVAHAFNGVPV